MTVSIHPPPQFVAGTQTLNTLAFVFDGVNFGASDYAFAAYSMALTNLPLISICKQLDKEPSPLIKLTTP
jgi:hypothetical protein